MSMALIVIGVIPFLLLLLYALYSSIFGVVIFSTTYYGYEALYNTIVLTIFAYWPVFVISILFIIIGIILKKKANR